MKEEEFQQAIRDYYKAQYEQKHGPISVQFEQFELLENDMANIGVTVSSANEVLARQYGAAASIDGRISIKGPPNLITFFAEQQ